MSDLPSFLPDSIQTFQQAESGDTFRFPIRVPEPVSGKPLAVVLSVHTLVASSNTADYGVTATVVDSETFLEAVSITRTTSNRRHRGHVFLLPSPPSGELTIEVKTGRAVSSFAAVYGLLESVDPVAPISTSGSASGNETELTTALNIPGAGAVIIAAQTRRGDAVLLPGEGFMLLDRASANPTDADKEVAAAMAFRTTEEAGSLPVSFSAEGAAVMLLMAVALNPATEPEPEPEPEPVGNSNELFIIVRDIPVGGSVEVRHVKTEDLTMADDGRIDWAKTPYTGFIITGARAETD